jgi:photosystem II stability/assembly factor-like uncharacterized protein
MSPSSTATPSAPAGAIDPTFVPALSGIQMVGPRLGWAVGQYAIFATTDGQHWSKQLTSTEQYVGVDFVSATTGWVVGARSLLATTNGGKTWEPVGEAPEPIRSVHFVSAREGWGVAGGTNPAMEHGSLLPGSGGVVVRSEDGGATWQTMDSPVDPQSVCFSDPGHGWLGTASGLIFSSNDGGASWARSLTALPPQNALGDGMVVECAAPSAAWAQVILPGAALSHVPYVVYTTQDGHSWRTVMAEPYTLSSQLPGVPAGPDTYPGSFSVVDPADAVFVGDGPATMVSQCMLASQGGGSLRRTGAIPNTFETFGAAFISTTTGWVLTHIIDGDYVIAATTDGGYHWSQQVSVAPSSAG